jgi:hypothetical protein
MLPEFNSLHIPYNPARLLRTFNNLETKLAIVIPLYGRVWHGRCYKRAGGTTMAVLVQQAYWDKKIRIAILTLATFAALC